MKMSIPILIVFAWCCTAALAAESESDTGTHTQNAVSVLVKTVMLKKRNIALKLDAYGTVEPDPSHVEQISLAYDGQVTNLWITPGQRVRKGQRLFALRRSPSDQQAYQQAQAAVKYAHRELSRERRLFVQKLATDSQVAVAEKNLADAIAALQAQRARGADQSQRVIRADHSGIVTTVNISQGQRTVADSNLLSLADPAHLRARLGVLPEDAASLKPGMAATITAVFQPGLQCKGSVSQVHAMPNSSTRLVDVIVPLNNHSIDFLPEMKVTGSITRNTGLVMAVPRSAVLTDSAGEYVFVVRDGHAHRIAVKEGEQNNNWQAVIGKLKVGDMVVFQGNYELHDGMAVRETNP